MRRIQPWVLVVAGSLGTLVAGTTSGAEVAADAEGAPARVRQVLASGPLHFEPAGEEGRFLARGPGYALHVAATASTLVLAPAAPSRDRPHPTPAGPAVVTFRLLGADAHARVEAGDELPGRSHVFHGSNPSKWRRNVPHFGRVTYREVYPGVDLTFHGSQGVLEHDFVLAPGVDPARIRFEVDGSSRVRLDDTGALVVSTARGEVRQEPPRAYQAVGGGRQRVASSFTLRDDREVGFQLGPHSADLPVVIDPVLGYSTFLGGSDGDAAQDVVLDGTGLAGVWVSGVTYSADLPGGHDGAWSGDQDVFVSRFATDGRLLSTTYIGGTSAEFGNRLRMTTSGPYLVGGTASFDFPSSDATCTACRPSPAGLQPWELYNPTSDAQSFLVKLSVTGELERVAVFGGSGLDNAWVLDIGARGEVHVGSTSCGDGFPTSPGAFRRRRTPAADPSDPNNECDVTIARFALLPNGLVMRYGTYLGGSGADTVAGLAAASNGETWVVGGTTSGNFPTTRSADQRRSGGGSDAFVTELAARGRSLLFSTYLGGAGYDYPFDVALGALGRAFVVGRTESDEFPTSGTAFQRTPRGGSDGFVAAFDDRGPRRWSTRLGGSGLDWPFAVALGATGDVYVAGLTESPDFPTVQAPQGFPGGGAEAFLTRVTRDGSSLRWSTYLGGAGFDFAHGLALDRHGRIWVVGMTEGGLPVTADAAQPTYGGSWNDGFLASLDESRSLLVRPLDLRLPRTRVGSTSPSRRVVLRNDGTRELELLDVRLDGSNPGDFGVSNGCPSTLVPGQRCVVEVTCRPSAPGERSARLLIDATAGPEPFAVSLSARAN